MRFEYGENIRIAISGGSHEESVGVEITGLPAGFRTDPDELQKFMDRRAPGRSSFTTQRKEPDIPVFESGMDGDVLNGKTVKAIIYNTSQRSSDYEGITDTPRPSHADLTARVKYGWSVDMRGGGPFSGRMTAPLCVAGGLALQILKEMGIIIGAHLSSVGAVRDDPFPMIPDERLFRQIAEKEIPVINDSVGGKMKLDIISASSRGDSIGGTVECAAVGVPAGAGGPLFQGIEGTVSRAVFGIPGVKGVEFGAGFAASEMIGSKCNDPIVIRDGKIVTETNNSGGILGGITDGMPIMFRAAFKPTPSISIPQRTVSVSRMEETTVTVQGRHDPCIAVRAVPVVEAAAAVAILDIIVGEWQWNLLR